MRVVSPPRQEPTVSAAQVRRVWSRYLRETQDAPPAEYEQIERRAWQRLTSNLAALGTPLPGREDPGDSSD